MIYATIQANVFDKDKTLIEVGEEKPSNSLLKNFITMLLGQMFQSGHYGKSTAETVFWDPGDSKHFQFTNNWRGMRVGSNIASVTMEDYNLTLLGASYGNHTVLENIGPTSADITVQRTFTNNSPTTPMSVGEVGWYSGLWTGASNQLIERTVYITTIPPLGSITLTYRIYITI